MGLKSGLQGWQIEEPTSGTFDCVTHALRFVCGQVIHDDDVARHQDWNENLLDLGLEREAVRRVVEDHGGGHALKPEPVRIVVF